MLSYGRVEQFIVLDATFLRELSQLAGAPFREIKPLVLAVVSPIPYMRLIKSADIIQYKLIGEEYAHPEVVDATKIDCLVGRVTSALGKSYLVERDTVVGQVDTLDETVDDND